MSRPSFRKRSSSTNPSAARTAKESVQMCADATKPESTARNAGYPRRSHSTLIWGDQCCVAPVFRGRQHPANNSAERRLRRDRWCCARYTFDGGNGLPSGKGSVRQREPLTRCGIGLEQWHRKMHSEIRCGDGTGDRREGGLGSFAVHQQQLTGMPYLSKWPGSPARSLLSYPKLLALNPGAATPL